MTCVVCGGSLPPGHRKLCSHACELEQRRRLRVRHPKPGPAERLAARVVRVESGCLEYTGYKNEHGYGVLSVGGAGRLAHRVAWTLANGPIPDGLCVRHSCDNPPCCELSHLSLGTHAENMADRDARGRTQQGQATKNAKLSNEDVRAIRAATGTNPQIAARFGVDTSTICKIRLGQSRRIA